jgi:hypothetical protein
MGWGDIGYVVYVPAVLYVVLHRSLFVWLFGFGFVSYF